MIKYFKDNLHAASVLILYVFFILSLIFLSFFAINYELMWAGKLYGMALLMIYIFMPISIILTLVYFVRKRTVKNFLLFAISFLPILSLLLMLYMYAVGMSDF